MKMTMSAAGHTNTLIEDNAAGHSSAPGIVKLAVTKQQLHRPQVLRSLVDRCCLGPPHRVRAIDGRIEPDGSKPIEQVVDLVLERELGEDTIAFVSFSRVSSDLRSSGGGTQASRPAALAAASSLAARQAAVMRQALPGPSASTPPAWPGFRPWTPVGQVLQVGRRARKPRHHPPPSTMATVRWASPPVRSAVRSTRWPRPGPPLVASAAARVRVLRIQPIRTMPIARYGKAERNFLHATSRHARWSRTAARSVSDGRSDPAGADGGDR